MELPESLRETLVNSLEDFLERLSDEPDAELVASQIIELLEEYADENGIDDIAVELEESGALDEPLIDALAGEMSGNSEFEYTEEECVSLLESMCEIEWVEDEDEDEDLDEEDF